MAPDLPATSPAHEEVEEGAWGAFTRPRAARRKKTLIWVARAQLPHARSPVRYIRIPNQWQFSSIPSWGPYILKPQGMDLYSERTLNVQTSQLQKTVFASKRRIYAEPAKEVAGGPSYQGWGHRPRPSPGRFDAAGANGNPITPPKMPISSAKTTPKIVSAPPLPHPPNTPKGPLWRTINENRAENAFLRHDY